MTDKEKIKAEIKRRIVFQKECIKNSYRLTGKPEEEIILEYKKLLSFIDSLSEEPVSNVWHDKSENIKEGARVCVLWNSGIITSGEWKYMDERPADIETLKMWAYESDILPTDKQKQKVGMTKEQATKYL